jgi:hypothetical protein
LSMRPPFINILLPNPPRRQEMHEYLEKLLRVPSSEWKVNVSSLLLLSPPPCDG